MAKWQCGKLIGARLCAPFFVYAHKRPDMQMAYLDQVLWKGGRLVFVFKAVGVVFVSHLMV